VRLYTDLAPWFHLLTGPGEYGEEAAFLERLVDAAATGPAETLLELGSGGGNNASHLKARFRCTLSDLSEQMLAVSASINPECEHVRGDMRTLRLGRTFDVVLIHDAVVYMTAEEDLRAALATVVAHLRPGGVALLVPDETAETYAPGTSAGGNDADDGRGVRYLEWAHPPAPGATSYDVDYVYLLRDPGGEVRVEHERHVMGLFPQAVWEDAMRAAGLDPLGDLGVEDPYEGAHVVLVARRR
jgi:trans-aconitate methyltransferase